jgi:type I restriction enzyme M protein
MLFIDARQMGEMVDRTHRELTGEEIARIAGTYHAWRGEESAAEYDDVPGFCKRARIEEIREHGHVLTPGRYVGASAEDEDVEPFEVKIKRLTAELEAQFDLGRTLESQIRGRLKELRDENGLA